MITCISNVLGDFIIVNASQSQCVFNLKSFRATSMCSDRRITISIEKHVSNQVIIYLGYRLNIAKNGMPTAQMKKKIVFPKYTVCHGTI